MEQKKKKAPLIFRVALCLFCLMLMSCYLIGGIYAQYISSVSASNSARVAVFAVSCSSADANTSKSIQAGSEDTASYSVTVQNLSEVSIEYTIMLENLPSGVTVKGNESTFTLGINQSRQHTITLQASKDAEVVNEQRVQVKINAVQKN